MNNGLRPQTPSAGFDWLYKDFEENNRQFSKLVYLGVNDTPWNECTDAERKQWEEEHATPEPEPQPDDTQPADKATDE